MLIKLLPTWYVEASLITAVRHYGGNVHVYFADNRDMEFSGSVEEADALAAQVNELLRSKRVKD